jgi:hypothetical protein
MKTTRQQTDRSCADGALSFKLMAAMTIAFGAVAITLQAAQPSWWATRGAVNTNPKNDSAVVNQGQLKKFTFGTECRSNRWCGLHSQHHDRWVEQLLSHEWIQYERL